ncbi:hypothetical protein THIAE_02155 [Thiomicrospira aerophila AL3]|uniref:DUF3429 domain-containing protein n=1 Tax=Thiomicrospira aerophila AL3 TaxID=717772 RepID=W0DU04_9GAMM|nr:DUF3429 domain-containing protein [Thiomicrospira aerophila]AHF00733.1 hypothetical protein THIAE_02155 [Thiomicrospira aerophila AL3]
MSEQKQGIVKSPMYQTLAKVFTYAGMLPFIYGALAALGFAPGLELWPDWISWPQAMIFYAAVILSFLAGVQWGRSLQSGLTESASLGLLVTANIIAVAVWVLLMLNDSSWAVLGLMLGFMLALAVDYVALRQQDQQAWFFKLRWQATLVALGALFTTLLV